jgi:hypothetical protein
MSRSANCLDKFKRIVCEPVDSWADSKYLKCEIEILISSLEMIVILPQSLNLSRLYCFVWGWNVCRLVAH